MGLFIQLCTQKASTHLKNKIVRACDGVPESNATTSASSAGVCLRHGIRIFNLLHGRRPLNLLHGVCTAACFRFNHDVSMDCFILAINCVAITFILAIFIFVRPVRLSLSAKSASYSAVFFSHNKSVNCTFSHDFSAKRTGRTALYNENI
jgi:hypothetical protein